MVKIENAELHFLQIPFRVSVTHGARARRTCSDSLLLRVAADGCTGWGEAVVRDYVSGSLGTGEAFRREAARIVSGLLSPLRDRDVSWADIAEDLSTRSCDPSSLPLLCAVEGALLGCATEAGRTDPFTVLGMAPRRATVSFGGVLPMFPLEQAGMYLDMFARAGLPDLKVKVGADTAYNDAILSACRERLGKEWDIRVDANGAWTPSTIDGHVAVCARHGVRVIEQPLAAGAPGGAEASSRLARQGFVFMADEGVLTPSDVHRLADTGVAQMLNLRLSKNGGLTRLLSLAREAESCGLSYQLGCMVGETGVLSLLGRIAAALLPNPVYLEGGYDDVLLERNITTPGFGFGRRGAARIPTGPGMGYRVEEGTLAELSRARLPV
jgi:L-Ala-D/L-Glu epimerase